MGGNFVKNKLKKQMIPLKQNFSVDETAEKYPKKEIVAMLSQQLGLT